MNEDPNIELINKEIDGLNSPEETSRLLHVIEENKHAKLLFEDLKQIDKILGNFRSVDPPAYLHNHIVNSLPRTHKQERKIRSFLSLPISFPFVNIRSAYVVTLFIGIAVGLFSTMFFLVHNVNNPENLLQVSGSSVTQISQTELVLVDEAYFAIPGASDINVSVKYSPEAVFVGIRGNSKTHIDFFVEFPPDMLTFDSFHQFGGEGNQVTSEKDKININFNGESNIGILFGRHALTNVPLNIKLSMKGQMIGQKAFMVNKELE